MRTTHPGQSDTPGGSGGGGRPSVCLCMIVKNEAAVIERCLASVRDLIDTWVISDTGSTDGTQDLIRKALDGIPGELVEEPWRDFGHNRTLNIQHAHGKADYLLLIDADMVVETGGVLPPLGADAYMLRHAGEMEYRIKRLVRGSIRWHYVGVTHEYLDTDQDHRTEDLDALVITHHADGGSRADKFTRDARLLTADLQRDPHNPRTAFYLAQTMRDLGEAGKAIELYERRAAMGGWEEEVYYSLFQVGVLRAGLGDWPTAMDTLLRAWEARPQRLEAAYELVSRLRLAGRHHTAHTLVRSGLDQPVPGDWLFVQPWIYEWGLLFEYSISAYWTGNHSASVAACDRLLALDTLPDGHRQQTLTNRRYGLELLPAQSQRTTAPAR